MDSYDVRFWDIKKLGNGRGRFRVRWAVTGASTASRSRRVPLRTGSSTTKDAVRDRRPFDPRTACPS